MLGPSVRKVRFPTQPFVGADFHLAMMHALSSPPPHCAVLVSVKGEPGSERRQHRISPHEVDQCLSPNLRRSPYTGELGGTLASELVVRMHDPASARSFTSLKELVSQCNVD